MGNERAARARRERQRDATAKEKGISPRDEGIIPLNALKIPAVLARRKRQRERERERERENVSRTFD